MKILLICSTDFYDRVGIVKEVLEAKGHEIIVSNGYGEPEYGSYKMNEVEYRQLLQDLAYESREKVQNADAVLALNYNKIKKGVEYPNYIGVSTFLEIFEAFMENKKIYILNEIPKSSFADDLKAYLPVILNGDIDNLK